MASMKTEIAHDICFNIKQFQTTISNLSQSQFANISHSSTLRENYSFPERIVFVDQWSVRYKTEHNRIYYYLLFSFK